MRFTAVVLLGLSLSALPGAAQETVIAKPYLVVTDRTSNNLLRYQTDGTPKDTFARQLVSSPEAVVFGPDQNLYFTSLRSASVERYNGDTGNYIGRFASAPLHAPEGLTFGPDGNLYVVDRVPLTGTQNTAGAVLRFDGATGAFIDEFVKQGSGGYDNPGGIAFGPDGNLYVTSGTQSQNGPAVANTRILRFDGHTGAFKDIFVSPNSGGLENPFSLIFGPDGNLYVSAVTRNSVLRYNGKTGAFIDAFVPPNSGGLTRPTGMAFGPDGLFYVASSFLPTVGILRFNPTTGAFIDVFIPQGSAGLAGPTDLLFYTFESQIALAGRDTSVATDASGNRMVVWTDNNVVKAATFDPRGNAVGAPRTLSSPADISSNPRVIATGDNSFFVAWQASAAATGAGHVGPRGASNSRIVVVPVPGGGTPTTPPRNVSQPPSGGSDVTPGLISTHHNLKVAVLWSRTDASGNGTGIQGRLVGVDGSTSTDAVQISSTSTSSDEAPSVASDGDDRVYVAWLRRRLDGTSTVIATGVTDGNLNVLTNASVADDGSSGTPGKPSITANSGGRVMLTVTHTNTQAASGPPSANGASPGRIVIVPIGGGGKPLGPPVPVSSNPSRNATSPVIKLSESGRATVVWQYQGLAGGTGVYGRNIDVFGNLAKSEYVVTDAANGSEDFNAPDVSVDANGNATISMDKTVSGNAAGVFTRTAAPSSASGACNDPNYVCLSGSRFAVKIDWKTTDGKSSGVATPIKYTPDSGLFWFFGPDNIEVLLKVLNACGLNGKYWIFSAATTDVEYTITVLDTVNGNKKTYFHAGGSPAPAITDTDGLPCSGTPPADDVPVLVARPLAAERPVVPNATNLCSNANTICLSNSRFAVKIDWKTTDGKSSGAGVPIKYTPDSGLFWFFGPDNIEVLLKVLNGCALNDRYWVFSAATTDVEYTITVTDTLTGKTKTYFHAGGTPAPAITDTNAMQCSQ